MATAGGDRTVKLWDVETWEHIRTFAGHEDVVTSVDFSPDGSQILSASFDESAIIWNVVGPGQYSFRGHYRALNAAMFTSNGKNIVTTSDDGTVRIWNTSTHSHLVSMAHDSAVWVVDDSPDGRWVCLLYTSPSPRD